MGDIPLPSDTARAYRTAGRNCRNFGLLFDRFVSYGSGWVMEGSQKADAARALVDQCNGWRTDPAYRELFAALHRRWAAALGPAGHHLTARPEWRLVVGLGRDSAFETGLTLHRIYGCPMIPGSALKGMTRAWAGAMDKPAAEITRIFGSDDAEHPGAGQVIFFDALPISPPQLELDMLNPHYPDYYRPGITAYPTDWQSPVPVYFMTVSRGTKFIFGVAPRRDDGDGEDGENVVETAVAWLRSALESIGVGGKTTSGYGYWEVVSS